tara:strand:+ start:864 stop:1712 length:849 start_codon:yes stop_codon:yes gene_type:complete
MKKFLYYWSALILSISSLVASAEEAELKSCSRSCPGKPYVGSGSIEIESSIPDSYQGFPQTASSCIVGSPFSQEQSKKGRDALKKIQEGQNKKFQDYIAQQKINLTFDLEDDLKANIATADIKINENSEFFLNLTNPGEMPCTIEKSFTLMRPEESLNLPFSFSITLTYLDGTIMTHSCEHFVRCFSADLSEEENPDILSGLSLYLKLNAEALSLGIKEKFRTFNRQDLVPKPTQDSVEGSSPVTKEPEDTASSDIDNSTSEKEDEDDDDDDDLMFKIDDWD